MRVGVPREIKSHEHRVGPTPASGRGLVARMKRGAVVVDVSIDPGGCVETGRATTRAEPTDPVDGVVHDGVANVPGGVPRTSTCGLSHVTLPFVLALAGSGWKAALRDDPHRKAGLDVCAGQVTCAEVATALGYASVAPDARLA